jgi:hypothetical protein
MTDSMRQFARRDSDRAVIPQPQPAVGGEGAGATKAPALVVGNGRAGSLVGRDSPSELMALQRTAGNHAVALLMGRGVVQRHPGPTANDEVEGEPGAEGPAEEAAAPTEAAAPATAETAEGSGAEGPVEEAAPTGLTGPARRKAIEDTLRASNTGTWAQSIIEKWKVPVDYDYGGVGSFQQGGNIYINKSLGIGAAAMVLMHEAQHANTYYSGAGADRTTLSRADYVKQSIADEAEATVRQIEGLSVTTGLGVDMTGNAVGEGLKQRYLKAFYAKRDELKKANPTMTTAEINTICRKFTRDTEVNSWFYDGTFVVSVKKTPTSYPIFYGNQWDEVHQPPAKK